MNQMQSNETNRKFYSEIYDKNYFLGRRSFFYKFGYRDASVINKKRLLTVLKFKTKGKILDVGCAYGFQLKEFERYFKVFGFDVSKYAIEKAKNIVPRANLRVHDAENRFPYPKKFFDVITCIDVLEHLKRPELLLKNIYRCLKPNGILFFSTPNKNNLIRKIVYPFPDKLEHHISMFSINSMINLLTKYRFKIVEYWTGFCIFNLEIWLKNKMGSQFLTICKK